MHITKNRYSINIKGTFIYPLLLLLLLVACSGKHRQMQERVLHARLQHLDSLANVDPARADTLLHTLLPTMENHTTPLHTGRGWGEGLLLLRIKVDDKLYRPITQFRDTILHLVNYFEKETHSLLLFNVSTFQRLNLSSAYLYAGRVFSDLGDAPQALDYYQRALDALPETPSANSGYSARRLLKQRGLLHSFMGELFHLQGLYDNSLENYKQANHWAELAHDTLDMIFNYRDIAFQYRALNENDSCLHFFHHALQIAKLTNNVRMSKDIMLQLASTYNDTGDSNMAIQYLRPSLQSIDSVSISAIYNIASKIYKKKEYQDSAILCYQKLIEYGNIYGKRNAYRELSEIALLRNDLRTARDYFLHYKILDDTIRLGDNAEAVSRMHAAYNYQKHELKAKELAISNEKKKTALILSSSIAAVLALLLIMFLTIYKKRKKEHEIRILHLQEARNSLIRSSEEYKIETRKEICQLEQKIQEIILSSLDEKRKGQEEIEKLNAEKERLLFLLKTQEATELFKKKAEEGIQKTSIYLTFKMLANSQERIPKKAEWEELSRVANSFYLDFDIKLRRLKRLNTKQYHVCLLRKLKFSTSDACFLVCCAKTTLYSICTRLYEEITGDKGSVAAFDSFISTL